MSSAHNSPVREVIRIGRRLAMVAMSLLASTATAAQPPSTPLAGMDTQSSKGQKPFTVKDSIEMVHFVEPWENAGRPHPQFSPEGDKFFIVTEKGNLETNLREYTLIVYTVKALNRPVRVATFRSSSNRKGIAQPRWVTNDSVSLIGENPRELPQVYIVNCRTRTVRKLTSASSGIVAFDLTRDLKTIIYSARWDGDRRQIEYKDAHGFAISTEDVFDLSSGEWKRPGNQFQTYVVDRSAGKTRVIKGGPFVSLEGRLSVWLSPDGKYAITERPPFPVPESWESYEDPKLHTAVHSIRNSMRSKLQLSFLGQAMLVSTQTGDIEPLVDAPLTVSFPMNVVWSRDSRSVIVAGTFLPLDGTRSGESAGRRTMAMIAEFDIPERSFRPIIGIPGGQMWSIGRGSKAGTFLVHAQAAEGESQILPDRLYRRELDMWVSDVAPKSSGKWHHDIVITQALDQWPRLVEVDPVTHKESVIYDPNPQLRYRRLGRVETLRWTGKLGETWIGGLVYPPDYVPTHRYPLVIQTHDFDPGIFLLDGPFTTAMAAQELANKGIVVLQIGEGPLHDQTTSKPEEGPYNLSGFESAVDHLDHLGIIDRSRVGLVGFSRTAYHVKYALTHSHYYFAAATAAEGIDFGYWQYIGVYAMHPLAQGEFASMYGGAPWRAGWRRWFEDSVSFNFDKIQTPLRLEANDNPSGIIEEWETFAALRLLNKPVELIFVPHGDHPLVKPWERMTSQEGNVDWFTFWLNDEEDANLQKTDQYTRWRELRRLRDENEHKSRQEQDSSLP